MSTYQQDKNKEDILLSTNGGQIMMEWEKPYMEASIDVLQPRGDVLEIGFGLGYSATQIMKYTPKSYTIIECDSVVIQRVKDWSQHFPEIPIHIVEGRWQEKLCTLGIFDEIYFDDYPLDITHESTDIEKILSISRLKVFVDFCIQNHTRIGSKMSWYSSGMENIILSSDTEPFVNVTSETMDIHIPDTCQYRNLKEQKCAIPLLEKIKEFDFMEAQRLAAKTLKDFTCGQLCKTFYST